jgi:DNA primase
MLYGLDRAKKEIAKRKQAVVVEGYTDVMACHLAGVPTAVATCGTAFGSDHIGLIRRLLLDQDEMRGEVIFTFDGDSAGQKAALKAFDSEQRFVSQTFIAVSPGGMDPCELRLAKGDTAVTDMIAARVPLVEFALRSTVEQFDATTTEGQLAALDAAAPLIAKIKDQGLRQRYAVNLDKWLGLMDEKFVLSRVAQSMGKGAAPAQRRPERAVDGAAVTAERELVKLAVQAPVLVAPQYDALDARGLHPPRGPGGARGRAGRRRHLLQRRRGAVGGEPCSSTLRTTPCAPPSPGWRSRRRCRTPIPMSGTRARCWPGCRSWRRTGGWARSSSGCSG